MVERVEIKGRADEFEAAVIAVVLDRIAAEEKAALQGRSGRGPGLSAWVRALHPEKPNTPRQVVRPEGA